MSDSLFSTRAAAPGKRSRFALLPGAVRTSEGGLAGLGTAGDVPYIVHELPRTVEAISAKAAAEAIAHGAIPAEDLVGVFAEVGKLDVLATAVAAAQPKPAKPAPK